MVNEPWMTDGRNLLQDKNPSKWRNSIKTHSRPRQNGRGHIEVKKMTWLPVITENRPPQAEAANPPYWIGCRQTGSPLASTRRSVIVLGDWYGGGPSPELQGPTLIESGFVLQLRLNTARITAPRWISFPALPSHPIGEEYLARK